MKKIWYDQRCVLCPGCAFFRPEGTRPESFDPNVVWPDGCGLYGYTLHDYPEPARDCDGFKTPEQYRRELEQEKLQNKRKKN